MILENGKFATRKELSALNLLPWKRAAIAGWLALLTLGSLQAEGRTPVSARIASVKGRVMVSTPEGGEKQAQKGDSIGTGTVIACGMEAGALLRPLPTLSVIIYPESRIRFDGADMNKNGGGSVSLSILTGKALFHLDDSKYPPVEVKVLTEEGIVLNHPEGTHSEVQASGKQPKLEGTSTKPDPSTWIVQHDEGRTMVAVSEGASDVSIGKGSTVAGGGTSGQIEVPKGSVIWLFSRADGRVDAELVDTITGKVTNLTGGESQGSSLVTLSRRQIVTPSSAGTASPTSTSSPSTGSTIPTAPPSNPDLSSPRTLLPVVSSDTP